MNAKRSRALKAEEQVRIRRYAVEQVTKHGAHPEDVAAALGYGRSTIFVWLKNYADGGLAALDTKMRSGRPPKLDKAQRRKLWNWIVGNDPRQLRFPFTLWCSPPRWMSTKATRSLSTVP